MEHSNQDSMNATSDPLLGQEVKGEQRVIVRTHQTFLQSICSGISLHVLQRLRITPDDRALIGKLLVPVFERTALAGSHEPDLDPASNTSARMQTLFSSNLASCSIQFTTKWLPLSPYTRCYSPIK